MSVKKLFISVSVVTIFFIYDCAQASFLSKFKSALQKSNVGRALQSDINDVKDMAATGAAAAYQSAVNMRNAAAAGINNAYNQNVSTGVSNFQNPGQNAQTNVGQNIQANQSVDTFARYITRYITAKVAYATAIGVAPAEKCNGAKEYLDAATEYATYISTLKQNADAELTQATQQYQAAQAAAAAQQALQTGQQALQIQR